MAGLAGLAATVTATTDPMRARYMAAIARRPLIPVLDRDQAAQLLQNATSQLREAYRLLRIRPDLSEQVERAGLITRSIAGRLALESPTAKGKPYEQ